MPQSRGRQDRYPSTEIETLANTHGAPRGAPNRSTLANEHHSARTGAASKIGRRPLPIPLVRDPLDSGAGIRQGTSPCPTLPTNPYWVAISVISFDARAGLNTPQMHSLVIRMAASSAVILPFFTSTTR